MYDYSSPPEPAAVMELFVECHPGLLTRDEVIREIGERVAVDDALRYLLRAGLLHRIGDTYWATRAAVIGEAVATHRPG